MKKDACLLQQLKQKADALLSFSGQRIHRATHSVTAVRTSSEDCKFLSVSVCGYKQTLVSRLV